MVIKFLEILLDISSSLTDLLNRIARISLKVQKAIFRVWVKGLNRKYNIKDDDPEEFLND